MFHNIAGTIPPFLSEQGGAELLLGLSLLLLLPIYLLTMVIGYFLRKKLALHTYPKRVFLFSFPAYLTAIGLVTLFGSDTITATEAPSSTQGTALYIAAGLSLLGGVIAVVVMLAQSLLQRKSRIDRVP